MPSKAYRPKWDQLESCLPILGFMPKKVTLLLYAVNCGRENVVDIVGYGNHHVLLSW
jgi:hypothetical protein